jgi:hypothetical protein
MSPDLLRHLCRRVNHNSLSYVLKSPAVNQGTKKARKARRSYSCDWKTLRIITAENDAESRGSLPAVERSMSDRLFARKGPIPRVTKTNS